MNLASLLLLAPTSILLSEPAEGYDVASTDAAPVVTTTADEPTLSDRALRVAALIDQGKYDAAQAILEPWLSLYADDAGLRLQELRLRLRTWAFVAYTEDYDNVTPLLTIARTAAQLDERLAGVVADEILWQVDNDLRAHAREGQTLMALAEWIYVQEPGASPGFTNELGLLIGPEDAAAIRRELEGQPLAGFSLAALPLGAMKLRMTYKTLNVGGGWMNMIEGAREIDPACGERWRATMAALPARFVERGMYASALLSMDAEGRLTPGFHYTDRTLAVLDAARKHAAGNRNLGHRLAVALLTAWDSNPAAATLWREKEPRLVALIEAIDAALSSRDARVVRGQLGLR